MKIFDEIKQAVEKVLPPKKGNYEFNVSDDMCSFDKGKLRIEFIYRCSWDLPLDIENDVLLAIYDVNSTRLFKKDMMSYIGGIRVDLIFEYNNLEDRIKRPSMRTLLGLNK